ncbi:Polyol:NADP oxidoreductase [Zhongshania aliphaticivorans]|uniref:Polyol:NADP oxidoreductase n=1 Tax=Zhongshania aliphaticivorans TaxID=1470434 RepID=A0A5S9N790_9GAMM|nr:mannitol dehydrogenase family protein [Zhongshania aliphaticivorans]CAA0081537.1 Polyol:NADP oxidoreductase [Zhongshania aliphaticivorans]CAA0084822.1 Polyol:NADP oxidoreductase [Zhongshania aliphaticivorans]
MNSAIMTGDQSPRLNRHTMLTLPDTVDIPLYDRSKLKVGIVHLGVGGFHRAHQAVYINELLKTPGAEQWAICGVGLFESNRKLRDILQAQDYLYSVTVRHPTGKVENKIVGSMIDFVLAPDNKQQVINKLTHPDTKIVSLTITEGGYNINPANGDFDDSHPDVRHDIQYPNDPVTAFGYIIAALKIRKDNGLPAFTVQSCDNIQHNGSVTKKMLVSLAKLQQTSMAEWIEENVCFPNAMVDRITPVTSQADIDYIQTTLGVRDLWPITCESFSQWVIEDDFCCDRPNWDAVGAQFVEDVTPYETMKIRLLNAGHSVLGLLGSIHGYYTIDEVVSDKDFATYLRAFMDMEVTPLLEPMNGIDLEAYKDTLIERFSNPNIKDSLVRICSESSAKLPKFLIATIQDNIAAQRDVSLATLVIAAWCLYCDKSCNELGVDIDIQDVMYTELADHAKKTAEDSLSFLKLTAVFGNLINDAAFTTSYSKAIAALYLPSAKIKDVMNTTLRQKITTVAEGM